MKKIISMILAAVLVFGMSINVFAAANTEVQGTRSASAVTSTVPAPEQPYIWECKSLSYGVRLQWDEVPDADAYMVYRKCITMGETKYTRVKKTKALVFRDRNVVLGEKYYYKVKAYKKVDGNTIIGPASWARYTTVFSKAAITEVTNKSYGVFVQWDAMSGVDGYKLYRRDPTSVGVNYNLVANTTGTEYEDRGIPGTGQYYYKVKGYKKVNGETRVSEASKAKYTYWMPKGVITGLENTNKGEVTITWISDPKSSGSQIKLIENGNEQTLKVEDNTVGSLAAAVEKGKTYQVKVRSYFEINGSASSNIWYGAWSDPGTVEITK